MTTNASVMLGLLKQLSEPSYFFVNLCGKVSANHTQKLLKSVNTTLFGILLAFIILSYAAKFTTGGFYNGF